MAEPIRLPDQYWAERTEPEVIDGLWCPATVCAACGKRFPPYMALYQAEDHCACELTVSPMARTMPHSGDEETGRCAAAPQPLWTGQTTFLGHPQPEHHSWLCGTLDVPPGTEVAVYPKDQTPPGVTRDQIRDVIWSALRPWMYPEDMAGDEAAAEEFEEAVPQAADAVLALLRGEDTDG